MLSEKLRPKNLDEFIGQEHLVGKDGPLRKLIESGNISSMIFWGPPGCGKTTLARLIPQYVKARFIPFSAVTNKIADVRKVIEDSKEYKKAFEQETIIFIDEIHRFNKAQQDAFLPFVEDGTIILIGATTENPGFEVNAPLISRSQIYIFKELDNSDIERIIDRALKEYPENKWEKEAKEFLITFVNGDARKTINAIEFANKVYKQVGLTELQNVLQKKQVYYDKKSDNHYDTISAFRQSMRGNKPDAALHYLARMLKGGEDPMFIARRMVIFASEDIGNARPMALSLAVSTMQGIHMVGMPEAQLLLSQCATYLATCPKSIASTVAISEAMSDIDLNKLDPIPLHLRNAQNKVMEDAGYSKDHVRYPWLEEKNGKKVNQEYMPKNLKGKKYYRPEEFSEENRL